MSSSTIIDKKRTRAASNYHNKVSECRAPDYCSSLRTGFLHVVFHQNKRPPSPPTHSLPYASGHFPRCTIFTAKSLWLLATQYAHSTRKPFSFCPILFVTPNPSLPESRNPAYGLSLTLGLLFRNAEVRKVELSERDVAVRAMRVVCMRGLLWVQVERKVMRVQLCGKAAGGFQASTQAFYLCPPFITILVVVVVSVLFNRHDVTLVTPPNL
ncbi:hypothetical protein D9758_010610 [Tetrapyrgos nigripes]|uniref:Uncharacterized protein n=1 Tax=Tetrapyrgos nigripes TaxID=182062 RepID=A0A8H5FYP2_9AGAR|nr:hypothetical protein D9758_010610 [Tetrapyrgos nigripes]